MTTKYINCPRCSHTVRVEGNREYMSSYPSLTWSTKFILDVNKEKEKEMYRKLNKKLEGEGE